MLITSAVLAAPSVDTSLRIYDYDGLIPETGLTALREKAAMLSDGLGIEFVAVISGEGWSDSAEQSAKDFYIENSFGTEPEYSGMVLFIDMVAREIYIATEGSCEQLLNAGDIDTLLDIVIEDLTSGSAEYISNAVDTYLDESYALMSKRLADYTSGTGYTDPKAEHPNYPENTSHEKPDYFTNLKRFSSDNTALWLGGSALAAGLVVAIMLFLNSRQLKKVPGAAEYIRPGSLVQTHSVDRFLFTHTTRRQINTDSNSGRGSSGGGSSGGRSMGGGGKRF